MKYKILKNKKYSVHTPGKILAAPLEWSFFNKDSDRANRSKNVAILEIHRSV